MKIPNDIVPLAYRVSKMVYEKRTSFQEGLDELITGNRINKNSAADYIHNFKCMLDGKKYARTNNKFSMEYFFSNIYQDYGLKGLTPALIAFEQHIEYYEGIRGKPMKTMRSIQAWYLALIGNLPDEIEQQQIIEDIKKQHKTKESIIEELKNLKETDSEVVIISSRVFKRDNKTIAQIKFVRDFSCQICSTKIKKKDGSYYIEACHIEPKHKKGRETPENILLLCPNHHKEFDLGNRKRIIHTAEIYKFLLNDLDYTISLKLE